jgi:hypothetical protein
MKTPFRVGSDTCELCITNLEGECYIIYGDYICEDCYDKILEITEEFATDTKQNYIKRFNSNFGNLMIIEDLKGYKLVRKEESSDVTYLEEDCNLGVHTFKKLVLDAVYLDVGKTLDRVKEGFRKSI